jgi:hypothetical protein
MSVLVSNSMPSEKVSRVEFVRRSIANAFNRRPTSSRKARSRSGGSSNHDPTGRPSCRSHHAGQLYIEVIDQIPVGSN